jgi:hypothetical protein
MVAAPVAAPSVNTTDAPALDLVEAPAPAPSPDEEVVVVRAGPIQPTYAIDINPPVSRSDGRGPIIIRGGRGGIHDPCARHGPRFGGGMR